MQHSISVTVTGEGGGQAKFSGHGRSRGGEGVMMDFAGHVVCGRSSLNAHSQITVSGGKVCF